jgi:hypothetical protein
VAEPLYRRALAITEKSLGPEHPNVAIRLNNLAVLLSDTNRLAALLNSHLPATIEENLSYSGFYCTRDFGQNAELRILPPKISCWEFRRTNVRLLASDFPSIP